MVVIETFVATNEKNFPSVNQRLLFVFSFVIKTLTLRPNKNKFPQTLKFKNFKKKSFYLLLCQSLRLVSV